MRQAIRSILLIGILTGLLIGTPAAVAYAQISLPAEINKSFSPISITAGQISRLTVSIFNPNAFQLTGAAWTDNLAGVQPGIVIANPVNMTNSCGGTVTANPGATTLKLIGGTVPPQVGLNPGSCTVAIDVTSTTLGNLVNTIPAGGLTATGGGFNISNTTEASATLRVGAVQPPSISKSFNLNTIWIGQTSQLRIVIRNNDLNTALTQATLTDTLPTNVFLGNPVSPVLTGCGNSASLSASAGGSSITLNSSTIAPNSTCTIQVNVTSSTPGVYTNTIPTGALQTQQGVTNASPANAQFNVQSVGVSKAFSPTAFQAGGTTTLTITLQNPTTSPYTGVSITDTLPGTTLTVVAGSATTTCGGVASTTLPRTVSLSGGTIPARPGPLPAVGTCTISVQATAPANATPGTLTNTIPANTLSADQPGVTNVLPATANVSVYAPGTGVTGTKSFNPTTINSGGNSRLRIDITAPADTNLTNFSIVDDLPNPPNVTISNSTPAATSGCGAGSILSAVTGAISISLTNGTILAGTRCRIEVYVTGSIPAVYNNVIPPTNINNNENRRPAANLSANLTVLGSSNLSVSKAFAPSTVIPNGISTLTITLQNTNASRLVNVSLLDTLPGTTTNGIVVAPAPNASTTCGAGAITAVAGSKTITMTGGTIPAQIGGVPGVCTITVDVQGKGTPATRTNTIPIANVTGTVEGTTTTMNPVANATAPITVANLTIGVVKGFNPLTVFGGSASTLSVQLVNPNNAPLTGITLTDNMPSGMIIANPPNLSTGTCGGTLTGNPSTSTFSFSGGSLPANTTCTLTLSVTMTVNGNLTNIIAANAVTTAEGVSNPQLAQASLTNLPGASISKVFAPNPIAAGSFSILTITIQNTGNVALTGLGLADALPGTLPNGLEVAGGAAPSPVNNCGGALTATPGNQSILLVGGSLAANSSCTIVVAVAGSTPGNYENCIPVGALTNNQGASNNQPACDTLVVRGSTAGLTKTVNPPQATIGQIINYQVNVSIPPGSLSSVKLVDTMDHGLAFVGCDSINPPGLTTTVSGGFPAICSGPTTDRAGSASDEDIDRRVTFDFGSLTNTTNADATLTVNYRAIVLDIASNLDGVNLKNSAVWSWANGSLGPVTTTVAILEPKLQVEKSADVTFISNGTEATITLTISHTGNSHLDAFDVELTDPLPVGMDYVANTIDCTTGAQDPDLECAVDTSNPAQPIVRARWSTFALGSGTGVVVFRVVGNALLPVNGSVTNIAQLKWTSLPGDHSAPQAFSKPPNPVNLFAVERFFDPGSSVNFYGTNAPLEFNPLGGPPTDDGGRGGGRGGGTLTLGGFLIPGTGFAPNRVTKLEGALPAYASSDITLEIPALKAMIPVVGVPLQNGTWDISGLWNQAGYLQGTAYPTFAGNSVITAHVVNADGGPGPFVRLNQLRIGDYIFIDLGGYRYTYQVITNSRVKPNDIRVFRHEEKSWITLITCQNYDAKTGKYLSRTVVRAVLIDIDTK